MLPLCAILNRLKIIVMKNIVFFFLWLLSAVSCTSSHDELYAELDKAVDKRSVYIQKKEEEIRSLKRQITADISAEAMYHIYNRIFEEYLAYKADSAQKVVAILSDIAREIGKAEYINDVEINKSSLLSTSGVFDKAEAILRGLDKRTFTNANYQHYYESFRWLYITWNAYLRVEENLPEYQDKVMAYSDSMLTVVPPTDVNYHYWLGEHYWNGKQYKEAEEEYLKGISLMSPLSRRYASITCSLAFVYHEQGKYDEFEKFMILSAIADQKIPLKENLAMQEIAAYLTSKNDIARANKYLLCALEDAVFYNNRLRLTQIARKFPDVVGRYQMHEKSVQQMQTLVMVIVCLLAILMFVFAYYIWRHNKVLRAQRKIRIQLNADLKQLNEKLQTANLQLQHTNHIREQYVSLFIELCAAYIDKYNKLLKQVERKVKLHQEDDILSVLHQNRLKDSDTREFFLKFDKAFLTLYPTFVDELNQLLCQDKQITLKKGELLSNELRLMALVRLGVKDTQKISTLLFYSPQTIYNYRSSMKNRAIDKENFEKHVESISDVVIEESR